MYVGDAGLARRADAGYTVGTCTYICTYVCMYVTTNNANVGLALQRRASVSKLDASRPIFLYYAMRKPWLFYNYNEQWNHYGYDQYYSLSVVETVARLG